VPDNPRAWLVSAGRFKAIDGIARRAGSTRSRTSPSRSSDRRGPTRRTTRDRGRPLRLIFTCCHPALAPDAQVALTLREVAA
jgi:RNA polymerase sigma-70 factor (ECF subfamily)